VARDQHQAGEVAGHLIELDRLVVADREADRVIDAGMQGDVQAELVGLGVHRVQHPVVDGDAEE
jgi:hypothetical protein